MSLVYRKDIDGLRAVAVLLVIFAHAKFSVVQGGFIGVDVFFVISGFLITSIIKSEFENHSFSILQFYMRRVRRILPALLFLLFGVCIASWFILLPEDMYLFAKSAVAGITAWSNVFFSKISGGYWGRDVSIMPLAHLWSLAIEEQFYFLWPTILWAAIRWLPIKIFKIATISLLVVLLGVSIYLSSSPVAYYQFLARAFEIFFGCTIALWRNELTRFTHKCSSLFLSSIGIILILSSATLLTENVTFPGWNAFWPCLGTGLLILPGQDRNLITRWLESSIMTFIGKISYSLYLWHWPILALLAYQGISIPKWNWAAILASFLMATVSYYYIEQPYRKERWAVVPTLVRLFVVPACFLLIFSQINRFSNGMDFRFSGEKRAIIAKAFSHTKKIYPGCLQPKTNEDSLPQLNNELCFWGKNNTATANDVDLILVGDSHASALRGFVEELSADAGLSGVEISQSNTTFLPNTVFYKATGETLPAAQKHSALVMNYITTSNAHYVAIAARYAYYLYGRNEDNQKIGMNYIGRAFTGISTSINEEVYTRQLERLVSKLVTMRKIPIIFKGVPEMGRDVSRDALRAALYDLNLGNISLTDVARRQNFIDKEIDKISKKYPQVIVVDPKKLLCSNERCYSVIDNVPLYLDDDHLNYNGSKHLGKKYLKQFGNPLISPADGKQLTLRTQN